MIKTSRRLVISLADLPDLPAGNKVLMYGDSITANAYTSNPDLGYPKQFEIASGLQVNTVARYSRSIIEGLAEFNLKNSLQDMIDDPTDEHHAQYDMIVSFDPNVIALTFRLGVNDLLLFCSNALNQFWYTDGVRDTERFLVYFKQTYIYCLQHFHNVKGWPLNRMYLINIGYYGGEDDFSKEIFARINAIIFEVAQFMNIRHIDLYSMVSNNNLNNRQGWYGDLVHPNDTGHPLEGQWLATQIPYINQ